ncbi:MAG: HAMP domain-containing histidine kinase [Clostridiales bacterium]|jgi:signal transduction histidine kinase|nr:HAMP domain-containing histidine kinase [Clostridiales bacterium]
MSTFGGNLETLEEMAATIAHEIKNPLALALANLDLIKVSDTEEIYKKYCSIIEQELFKINRLVMDLIHITLSEEREEMFDLTAMLDDLASEYQRRYETITFSREPGLCSSCFCGVEKKIQMVFTNILNNAVEAVSQKGVIEIVQENGPDTISITINDNGIGLPRELLDNRIDLFTTKENGTGVGLYYCRATIGKCGGRFLMRNRPGGGCSVTVELPLKK